MRRNIKLQKPVAHISIRLGKRESNQNNKVYDCSKGQRLSHQGEISKVSGINLKMRCIDSK